MSDVFEMARTLAVLRYLADKLISERAGQLGREAVAVLPAGTRLPVEIGGTVIASVSVPAPAMRCKVTSGLKYLAWVRETRPDEIEDVPTVRSSFDAAVKASVREHGGWLDKATGDIVPVPGMERTAGEPYARVELKPEAGPAIGQAWRDGTIDLGGVLALPAGDGDA